MRSLRGLSSEDLTDSALRHTTSAQSLRIQQLEYILAAAGLHIPSEPMLSPLDHNHHLSPPMTAKLERMRASPEPEHVHPATWAPADLTESKASIFPGSALENERHTQRSDSLSSSNWSSAQEFTHTLSSNPFSESSFTLASANEADVEAAVQIPWRSTMDAPMPLIHIEMDLSRIFECSP